MANRYEFAWRSLEGKIYKPDNLPRWENTESYPYFRLHINYQGIVFVDDPEKLTKFLKDNVIDPTKFPVEYFPLIEDFHIELWTTLWMHKPNYEETYRIIFFSPSHGLLGGTYQTLPDLCQEDFVLPWGDFTIPYVDFDQSWAILIAEKDQFVYVLQGEYEKIDEEGYERWFKVEKNRYREEWDKTMRLAHAKGREWFTQQRVCPPETCE